MGESNRLGNSLKNIITGIGGYIINTLCSFIGRLVFIRCLPVEYLGISGLFTNILTMLSLAELGIGSAITYALYKPLAKNNKKEITALMRFYRECYKWIGTVVFIIGIILLPFLKYIIGDVPKISENIYFIYFLYLLNTSSTYFFSYKYSLLSADQKFYIVSGFSYIISFITTLIQIIILILTKNYILYLLIQFSSVLIYNIILSRITDKKYPFLNDKQVNKIDKITMKELIKNVRALVIIKISSLLVNSTDNIIISYFKGLAITGLTSNYILFSNTINSLLTQIFNGITASVGNYNALSNDDDNLKLFQKINFLNFWTYGWCSICFVILANDLIEICFGQRYILNINIALAIGINLYVLGMQNASWTYKSTLGLFNYGKYILLITAGLNLTLSIFLGKIWGVFGILISTTISRIFTNVWYEPYAVFKYGLNKSPRIYFKRYILYAIVTIICFLSTLLITMRISIIFNTNIFIKFIIKLIICIILPNIVIVILFNKTEEFKYVMNIAQKLIRKVMKQNDRYKKQYEVKL